VEEIFAALEADGGEWAAKELALLRTKSPQALKITLRQMRLGARMASFEDEMTMEFRMASRVALLPDFAEGRARLSGGQGPGPRWNPPTLEGCQRGPAPHRLRPAAARPGVDAAR
jgi:enoyl-CoA hydratase